MRKIGKTILTICVVFFAVIAMGLTALTFGIKLVDQSGWAHAKSGDVYYLDWEGVPQTGWKTIEGRQYYFDPMRQGSMAKGWLEIDERWYYFDDSGVVQTGWLDLMGSRFYLCGDGTMATGWQTVDNGQYFFDDEGELQSGWLELDGRRFYLGIDGKAVFGWHDTVQGRCYLPVDGTVYQGWQELDGDRYFFNTDGFLVYGWLAHENEYYYLDSQGVMQTGWLKTETGTYYLDDEGRLKTGWLDLTEGRYFLGTDGILDTGWVSVGGSRYYMGEDGRMQTGWLDQDGSRYYLGNDGAMSVGKVEIDGTNCFFTSQGKYVLLVNRENPVPEGYEPDLADYESFKIDQSCQEPLEQLLSDCAAAGHEYILASAYRSAEEQQALWDARRKALTEEEREEPYTEEEIQAILDQELAAPGYSEHELGLAVDLEGDDALYSWLREKAWEYGFIVRYPAGKDTYTGYAGAPGHLRYVGTELAKELQEKGLTLEEYMEKLTK